MNLKAGAASAEGDTVSAAEYPRCASRRFKPYAAYKDCGIDWLAAIPAHWNCLALSRVCVSRCDGPFGSGLKSEHYSNEGVRVIRLQNIGWAKFSGLDEAYIHEAYASKLGDHSVVADDLLIAGLGDERHPVGRACAAPQSIEPAIVKADCFRFRLDRRRFLSQFAAYQLSTSASATAGSLSTGSTRARINLSATAVRKIALPPIDEQEAITAFLDREMARIDALVAKKEQLIALLLEKRAALITRAVIKGLDPSAPMRDSGVEWLGQIPAHWGVTRLRYGCSLLRDGTHQPPQRVATGYPLLSVRNIVDGKLVRLPDDSMISETEFQTLERSFSVRENDVLLAIVGATLGKVAIVPSREPFAVQRSLAVLRPRRQLLHFGYLASFLQSQPFQSLLWQSVGYSAQPGIISMP